MSCSILLTLFSSNLINNCINLLCDDGIFVQRSLPYTQCISFAEGILYIISENKIRLVFEENSSD